MARRLRVAVIGGGWAGLAAAVQAVLYGHEVTLYEMATQLGGRARAVEVDGMVLDNGQHILIGAYAQTLRLMHEVGADIEASLWRAPLQLVDAYGAGLRLNGGSPGPAFARAVLAHTHWSWREKFALLRTAAGWAARRFRCDPRTTVAELATRLPGRVRTELIEPLCVAALNTPAADASATVFLRVLKDALFAGAGSSDLLLPRRNLSECFPRPAARWLATRGATLRPRTRVDRIQRDGDGWHVDGETHDRIVLATAPGEAARLARDHAPGWATSANALHYEPIATVYARSAGARLPLPMLTLPSSDDAPAQFVFDRGALGGPAGLLAFVISGAAPWLERGTAAAEAAVLRQADALLSSLLPAPPQHVRTFVEKRATFRCTPALERPPMRIAPGLVAAGDFVAGPYPATLEGATLSGVAAAQSLGEMA